MTDSPLSRDAVTELVKTQLAEILEKSPSDIATSASFAELGADSLSLIELIEAIEAKITPLVGEFHINDEDLAGLTTVQEAVDYVTAKLAA